MLCVSNYRLTILAAVALAAALMSAGGCGRDHAPSGARGSAPTETPAVEVELAAVKIGPAERAIEVSGTLFGEEETVVSSKLSGRVTALFHDVGDAVEPGGALAQQEVRDYELELVERRAMLQASLAKLGLTELPPEEFDPSAVPTVVRARAEEANAEARYGRARQLFEDRPPLISQQDFADIETQREVARSDAEVAVLTARSVLAEARTQAAAAAVAEQRLADTTIRAPASPDGDGPRYTVAERLVSLGEFLAAGTPAFRLVATELIKFRAEVPERYVGQVREGQGAAVWMEAYPEPFAGHVARISPSIDPQSRTFRIEINLPNPDGRLRSGAFARGRVSVEQDQGVTFVPESAVVTFAGVRKVFSVSDGKAVEHRVKLGIREGGFVEVLGGLDAESVVTSGSSGLAAGVPVRVREQ